MQNPFANHNFESSQNPFANFKFESCQNFKFDTKSTTSKYPTIRLSNPNSSSQSTQSKSLSPKCDNGKQINSHGSGAYGSVYSCGNDGLVYKQFANKSEYDRVKANLLVIIPKLIEKKLITYTCFNGIALEDMFNDIEQMYKMNKCKPLKRENVMDPLEGQVLAIIREFNNLGFIHGDIKLDNIMMKDQKIVLTDIDDMCFIKKIGNTITCSNLNYPMFTPVFVHPVYLQFRLHHSADEKKRKNILEEFVGEYKNMYICLFNIQAKGVDMAINADSLEKIKVESIDQLNSYLLYSDSFSFMMDIIQNRYKNGIYHLPVNIPKSVTTIGGGRIRKWHAMRLSKNLYKKT